MNASINGCGVTWLFGSRDGTSGKIHKLQITNKDVSVSHRKIVNACGGELFKPLQ
jgi:hypothetical protein